jgi:hypothetical protein
VRVVAIVLFIVGLSSSGCSAKKQSEEYLIGLRGAPQMYGYIPWPSEPYHYAYKDYTGSPGIDDEAFAEVVEKKAQSLPKKLAYVYAYTEYTGKRELEVRKMAEYGDPEAMYELYARSSDPYSKNNISYQEANEYLHQSASKGYLPAIIDQMSWTPESLTKLDVYEEITPQATRKKYYIKLYLNQQGDNQYDVKNEVIKFKYSGFYHMDAIGVEWELENGVSSQDTIDILCEYAFNGHVVFYRIKKEYGIKCQ